MNLTSQLLKMHESVDLKQVIADLKDSGKLTEAEIKTFYKVAAKESKNSEQDRATAKKVVKTVSEQASNFKMTDLVEACNSFGLHEADGKLYLWSYNKITGFWNLEKEVTPDTQQKWLDIFKKDEPDKKFKISKKKPSYEDGKKNENGFVAATEVKGMKESADYATIAKTILQQLGGNKFLMMTGAKNLSYGEKNSIDQLPYLSMKLPRNASKANMLIISLNGKDLYNMHFLRLSGADLKPVVTKEDIYDDQLRDVFTDVIELYTSLGTMGRNESLSAAVLEAYGDDLPAAKVIAGGTKGIGAYQLPSGKYAVLGKWELESADRKKMPIDKFVADRKIQTFDKPEDAKKELYAQLKNEELEQDDSNWRGEGCLNYDDSKDVCLDNNESLEASQSSAKEDYATAFELGQKAGKAQRQGDAARARSEIQYFNKFLSSRSQLKKQLQQAFNSGYSGEATPPKFYESLSTSERKKFVNYVLDFYGKGGIYAKKFFGGGVSADEVEKALDQLLDKKNHDFAGDSFDRELIRDIMIKNNLEHGDKLEEARKFDLGAGHLGNGITVWNRAKEVSGDYETIAHIDSKRNIKWYLKNPPQEVVDYVEGIAKGKNMKASTTQDQTVFDESSRIKMSLSSQVLEAYKDENWISGITFGSSVEKKDAEKIAKDVTSKFGKDGFSAEVIPDIESEGYFAVKVKHRESSDFDDAVALNRLAKQVKEFTRKQITDVSKYWLNKNEASSDYKEKDKEMMDLERKLRPLFGDGEGYDGNIFASAKKNKGDFFKLKEYQKNYKSQNKYAPDIKKYIDLLVWLNDGNESLEEAGGSGFGGWDKGQEIKDINSVSVGMLIAHGDKQFKAKNIMKVTKVDKNKGLFYALFVDPEDTGRKRRPDDKEFAVWDYKLEDGGYHKAVKAQKSDKSLPLAKPKKSESLATKVLEYYNSEGQASLPEYASTKEGEVVEADYGVVVKGKDASFWYKTLKSAVEYAESAKDMPELTIYTADKNEKPVKAIKKFKAGKEVDLGEEMVPVRTLEEGGFGKTGGHIVAAKYELSDGSIAEIRGGEDDSFGTMNYSVWHDGKKLSSHGSSFPDAAYDFKKYTLPELGLKIKKELKKNEGFSEGKMFDDKEKYLEMLKRNLGANAQEIIDKHRSFIDKSFNLDVSIPQLVKDLKKKDSGVKSESLASKVLEAYSIEGQGNKKHLKVDKPLLANLDIDKEFSDATSFDIQKKISDALKSVEGFNDSVHYNLKAVFTQDQLQKLNELVFNSLEKYPRGSKERRAWQMLEDEVYMALED